MRLTRRGEVVFILGLALALVLGLLGIYKAATSIHWTGDGYCIGSFTTCYDDEGGRE